MTTNRVFFPLSKAPVTTMWLLLVSIVMALHPACHYCEPVTVECGGLSPKPIRTVYPSWLSHQLPFVARGHRTHGEYVPGPWMEGT